MALYLVTGGAGFIGSHISTGLFERGDRVRVFDDLSTGRRENLAHLPVGDRGSGRPVELWIGELADPEALHAACAGVDGVFHEAAQVSVPQSVAQPLRSYETNALATLRLLEACRAHGVRRLVFAASSAAYGETEVLPKVESMAPAPLSPYAAGKVAAEHLLAVYGHIHGMRTVSLRYFNIFGPRQLDDSPYTGVIAIFAKALLEGRRVQIFGDGEQTRDFTFVDNVVRANLLAMDRDVPAGAVVNVGGGRSISINQLYREMARLLGCDLAPIYQPARAGDVRDSLASLERAQAWLGYEPVVDWRAGLEQTVAWYKARHARRSK
ncbi:MAG: NAD-dependent epimerase/dehydratase family protein [Planctomycetes bacterium]|nr:NAD-dependent epimerase/dehydratase family protein [Planctomycetota bacterium]